MDPDVWPERDQAWVARYRRSVAGKPVPGGSLEQREHELLGAVRAAGVPAVELFGDAAALAAEDVAELATVDEDVRTSPGGGLRPALQEVGGTLMGMGAVLVLSLWIRNGWSVDVRVAPALVAVSVASVFVAWVVGRALFSAGRPGATAGVLLAAAAVALAGIAAAASLGPGPVAARDVPVPLLGLGLLAPGVLALVAASRLPQQTLRESWDDAAWLHRFQGGLRTRLVPSSTTRGHVDEVHQAIGTGTASAFEEFGHPLVLARQLADADRTARARRCWVSTVAGTLTPLTLAALVHTNDSWGALTTPLVVLFALGAVITLVVRWDDRPWRER